MMTNGGGRQGKRREGRLADEQRDDLMLTKEAVGYNAAGTDGRAPFPGGKRCRTLLNCHCWDSQEFSGENEPRRGTSDECSLKHSQGKGLCTEDARACELHARVVFGKLYKIKE